MPITRVKLNGYKGQFRDLYLDGPTLLNGPNGIGKSAVKESVVYALLGKVSEGRALDRVAHYFPPRGGDVLLEDDRRNWITRGIKIDHEKKKTSEVLDTSSTAQDARQVDLRDWEASPAVLDLDELLALSPAERRKFVLKLCGEGEAIPNLYQLIEDAYVKEICGPAVGSAMDVFARLDDLPDKERALVEAWQRSRGVGDVVESVTKGSAETLTQILLKAGQVATQNKLVARRAADEAKKAIKELEAEAQGARVAASELRTRQREADQATEKLAVMRERRAAREEIRVELEGRQKEGANAAKELEAAREALSKTPESGREPLIDDSRREDLTRRIHEFEREFEERRQDIIARRQEEEDLRETRQDLDKAQENLELHREERIGKVCELVAGIPDEAHENVRQLKAEIAVVSESWRERGRRLGQYSEQLEKDVKTLTACLSERRESYDEAEAKLSDLERRKQKLQSELNGIDSNYRKEVAEWHEQGEGWYDAKRKVDEYEGLSERLAKQEEDLRRRLEASGEESGVEEAESSHFKAKKLLEQAQKAAGAADAYESAVQRAERQTVMETAWKACEHAVNAVREEEVYNSTRPLLETMDDFLSACGRPERAYIALENERGKPIFEMGWIAGDLKKALPALSDGEAVLFCAGLSLAVALRASGRRMLLIEADHLDQENLSRLLTGLLGYKEQLEALIVATKTPLSQFDGWTIANLGVADADAS